MARNGETSKLIDEVLRYGALTAITGVSLVAPGITKTLDKPLKRLAKHLDERERAREARRIVYYMKGQGYLAGDYEHGLELTDKARQRLQNLGSTNLVLQPQPVWDHLWRIILYDIPDEKRSARQALQHKLRMYGCFQLQRSVLITPFPCLADIETLSAQYEVDSYVTYFEAQNLRNETVLIKRFQKLYPATKF